MSINQKSISNEIKKRIGLRIFIFITFLISTLILLAINDAFITYNELNKKITSLSNQLSDYIISQTLLDNRDSIDLKIKETEKKENITIAFNTESFYEAKRTGISWSPLLNWHYCKPVIGIDNKKFGIIYINGSLLSNSTIVYDFLTRCVFIFISLFIAYLLLYPLTKNIPDKIFIQPIFELLNILNNGVSAQKNTIINTQSSIELIQIKAKILELIESTKTTAEQLAIIKISTQVAHDIRSPLMALSFATRKLNGVKDEHKNIIFSAIERIDEIAGNLLHKHRITTQQITSITPLLNSIYLEKTTEYSNKNINFILEVSDDFNSLINVADFKRVISNLINNAVNAVGFSGSIKISTNKLINSGWIAISDSGCGMPKHILNNLENNISSTTNGNGLGLNHAIKCIKEWNGSYSILTKENEGTTFSIELPCF